MVMGTYATLSVPASERAHLPRYRRVAADTLRGLEERLSVFIPTSDITRLNQGAGGNFVGVSEDTVAVLASALEYARLTAGAFDVTVGPLLRCWGFYDRPPPARMPDAETLAEARQLVGYGHLGLSNRSARLEQAGMAVDLGGIAKGYAVDVCYRRLIQTGASNLLVNLGGNIRCGGSPGGGRSWRIAVRNPFDAERPLGTLNLSDGLAVATSGNYERFVVIGGKKFAHIIDPRTGFPVRGMASVTVVAPTAVEADALSTGLFVLGPTNSRAVLAARPACAVLFVPDEQPLRLLVTGSFLRHFSVAADWSTCVEVIADSEPR